MKFKPGFLSSTTTVIMTPWKPFGRWKNALGEWKGKVLYFSCRPRCMTSLRWVSGGLLCWEERQVTVEIVFLSNNMFNRDTSSETSVSTGLEELEFDRIFPLGIYIRSHISSAIQYHYTELHGTTLWSKEIDKRWGWVLSLTSYASVLTWNDPQTWLFCTRIVLRNIMSRRCGMHSVTMMMSQPEEESDDDADDVLLRMAQLERQRWVNSIRCVSLAPGKGITRQKKKILDNSCWRNGVEMMVTRV